MDSLSQIVLGAAVGEAVLGKKAGNRAMLWGAVAGTIPDLDVISNLWMNELDALAFHRGPTHSIFFAILASFPLAWLVQQYYEKGYYHNRFIRITAAILASISMILIAMGLVYLVSILAGRIAGAIAGLSLILLLSFLMVRLWKNYASKQRVDVIHTKFKDWYWLFFLGLFTHAILDCFTTYGTQLFTPLTHLRVSLNNIAVVDPLWTFPFLAFLIAAAFKNRDLSIRSKLNYLGIIVSSIYMLFTLYNKYRVDSILTNTLAQEKISYSRYMTTPTIFNNILWSATVESDSLYYVGTYSFFDKEKSFKITSIPKNHHLVPPPDNDHTLGILSWFSNGYFNIMPLSDDKIQYSDLRFGIMKEEIKTSDDFVFSFILKKNDDGSLEMLRQKDRPKGSEQDRIFTDLIQRIRGI